MKPMSNLLKKLVISLLLALTLLLNFRGLALAETGTSPSSTSTLPLSTWYNSSFNDWYGKVYDSKNPGEIFGERYTAAQVQWVIYGLFGFLINTTTGPQNAEIVQCFLNNVKDINTCSAALLKMADASEKSNLATKSVPQNQNLWSLVFADRPLSGVSYVREKFGSFKLVPEVHAQTVGIGFDALKPIQGMWRAFRDIAFGLFVIIAVVFAFMIMFRVKLSPQTVISVQSALPKIVVALVLVTFSYAIAGLLVDLMYVVLGLISVAAAQIFSVSLGWKGVGSIGIGASQYFNFLTLGQPLGLNIQAGVFGLIGTFYAMFFLPLFIALMLLSGGLAITGIGSTAALIVLFIAMLLQIVAVLVGFWVGIKVIWALLKAFVNIILLTIFAPIQIALGAVVPSMEFGQWVRSYVSNLAIFVVTGTLFLFSFLFIIQGDIIIFTGTAKGVVDYVLSPFLGRLGIFIPSLGTKIYPAWPPLLGSGGDVATGLLFLGVSFVLFTLTPKANEIIQGLLSGKPFAYGTAIGEAFGGVGAAYGATLQPGVEGMRKYGQEKMMVDIMTRLNNQMQSGSLQWAPKRAKEFVKAGSKATPTPFH